MKRDQLGISIGLMAMASVFIAPAAFVGLNSSAHTSEIERLSSGWMEKSEKGFHFRADGLCADASAQLEDAVFELVKLDRSNPGSVSMNGFGFSDATVDFTGRLLNEDESSAGTEAADDDGVEANATETDLDAVSTVDDGEERDGGLPAMSLIVRQEGSSWCAHDLKVYAKQDS